MHGETSTAANMFQLAGLYAVHCLVPAILLLTTPKHSTLRYLSVPFLLLTAYQGVLVACALGPGYVWCEVARLLLTVVFQALDVLFIRPRDGSDVPLTHGQSLIARLYDATKLLTHPRGINTGHQTKNVPPQPAYYARRNMGSPPRGRFLLRQSAIAIWQYLALDLFSTVALQQALAQDAHEKLPPVVQWNLSVEQWVERLISNLVAGAVVSRMIIDLHHRVFSIIMVGLGLESPSECPPLFGRIADAGSLRGFWGKFWHQMLRHPLSSVSEFLALDVLGLPRGSLLGRYTVVYLVFFFSAGLHVVLDLVQGIPLPESGALLLFTLAPLGLMIEDGVKAAWKRSRSPAGQPLFAWTKGLGLLWSMAWLGITSTWFFYPQMLRPQNQNLVPLSLAQRVGLPVIGGIAVVWGVLTALVFEVEV
ncbi:hypothetical protein N7468_004040 [Penicillium chermesinum]|uniref:Wax synthase domain-containing protein n=1 Tax=Penicillium chermesinum TaxID=63820 RepID=A0A9W9TS70_9EURO|nr:uncharacterized protein N7468_004040 [Penicillium chermesinum]KAJ5239421.1 hypothetical protein N7468_004040 [Penicillium chermesinum]KAJ6141320.1 hypothetical protein N7470_010216 [Penicillium chermesinum]